MVTQLSPGSVPATVTRVTETVLPTKHGVFQVIGYRDSAGTEHVALARGLERYDDEPVAARGRTPLVRVHSECLTGDAFGSWRCDCGEQLDTALAAVAAEGLGVVVYVRGHEGRGIGLLAKLKAYALQDQGVDTVDANTALGLPVDARRYDQAAEILQDLGISSIRLLSGNPAKEEALAALGITVAERRALPVAYRPENAGYLATKRDRMRHDSAPSEDAWHSLLAGEVPVAPATGTDEELVHRYGRLAASRGRLTVGRVRQSLDGFALPVPGSAGLSSSADLDHGRRLHALVDAVVVGASALGEDVPSGVGDVPGNNPVRVVVDRGATADPGHLVPVVGDRPTLWVVASDARVPELPDSVEVVRLPTSDVAPRGVLDVLHARGLGRVLVDDGGVIVSGFLEAGLLDRLYLLTVPVLLGDGAPGIRFSGGTARAVARDAPTRRFVIGADICTEFDLSGAR